MTNLDSILQSRDMTLPTKVRLVKAMVFPVVMYGCESWTVKKAEHRRIDAFELWYWRRLSRVPWTARRSVLGVHWKDWCWSWNSSTLATWCEELTHWQRPWCWEGLGAGGEWADRGWDGWMASPTRWAWVRINSRSWWWTGRPGVLRFMGSQRVRHDWATGLNLTEISHNTHVHAHTLTRFAFSSKCLLRRPASSQELDLSTGVLDWPLGNWKPLVSFLLHTSPRQLRKESTSTPATYSI